MGQTPDSLVVYRELAERYDQIGQGSMRDRFLILAADAALKAGHQAEAERLRLRLLQHNRHHMLRPYSSFAEACSAADVQTYIRDLLANYPLEVARKLLGGLGNPEQADVGTTAPLPPSVRPLRSASTIPPTAPLVDPYESQPGPAHQPAAWQPATPYRLVDQVEAAAPARIPRGPIPGTSNREPVDTHSPTSQPGSRPTRPMPGNYDDLRARLLPRGSIDTVPVPSTPPRTTTEETGGALICSVLFCVAAFAGVALALFTLARPFLPPEWIP
ncbi:MAG: hypothetical protein U0840_04615 [Gemmataceae bacterium]